MIFVKERLEVSQNSLMVPTDWVLVAHASKKTNKSSRHNDDCSFPPIVPHGFTWLAGVLYSSVWAALIQNTLQRKRLVKVKERYTAKRQKTAHED